MAYLKNEALFFTTSPRTPSKMIPEIQLLSEHFTGRKWNKQSQIEFVDLLAQFGFFEGSGSPNNKDFSARDRINRAPKALGFVDLSPQFEKVPDHEEKQYKGLCGRLFPVFALYGACFYFTKKPFNFFLL